MLSFFAALKHQLTDSLHTLRRTQTLTTVGIFLAIQMVLSSYGTIQVSESLKISFSHLALVPTAIFFGPIPAALQGAFSDILGFLLKPTGPYFPGFTLTALLGGFIYGMVFYRSACRPWQIILARLLVAVLVNILLNTYFLTMLYGPAQLAALPVRVMKNVIQFPIDCILLSAMCTLVHRLRQPSIVR